MEIKKVLGLENDGLNMATDGQFLFVRCKRTMLKYRLVDMSLLAENVIFKKDGKARNFSVCEKYIFLTDFCDLYILNNSNLQVLEVIRLGEDLSSDLGVVRFDEQRAYINIRNGTMAVMDIETFTVKKFSISNSSSWDHTVVGKHIYTGTVNGELIETDKCTMQSVRKIDLGKKNIYSVFHHNGALFTVSQDMTIKAVNIDAFEIGCVAKKAVKGMTRILGVHNDSLVIADGGISLWDIRSLELQNRFDFPTGHFNKGVLLYNNMLIGSDYESIYYYML